MTEIPSLDFGTANGEFCCPEHGDIKGVFILKVDNTTHYYCPNCVVNLLNRNIPAIAIGKKEQTNGR